MNTKQTSLFAAGLLLTASLASLLSFTGCLGPDAPNDSERPQAEPRGFQFQGFDRRDR